MREQPAQIGIAVQLYFRITTITCRRSRGMPSERFTRIRTPRPRRFRRTLAVWHLQGDSPMHGGHPFAQLFRERRLELHVWSPVVDGELGNAPRSPPGGACAHRDQPSSASAWTMIMSISATRTCFTSTATSATPSVRSFSERIHSRKRSTPPLRARRSEQASFFSRNAPLWRAGED